MTTRKDSQGHELVANPFVAPKGEPSRWVSSGLRRIELGDFLGALMDAERALEAAPGDADAHRVKAQALSALGRFEEARAAALDAVALAPQSAAAYEVLAWALANLGDYAGAARAATRALELDPKDAFAYAIRAFARQKLGDRDGAAADAREAALRNPAYQAQAAAAAAGRPLNPPPLASLAPAAASAPRPSAGEPEPVSSAPPVWPALVAGGLILLMLGGIGFAVVFRRGSVTTP
jgi:tetratricopeptide (TPR) repeat protein